MSFQLSLSTESVSAAYPDQPLFVTSAATVGEVIQLLRAQQTGSILICEGDQSSEHSTASGQLLGIFTERDALVCMAKISADPNSDILAQPITEAMSTTLTTLQTDTSMGDAIKLMSEGNFRHLPICDTNGAPTGMETVYGIVHYLVDHFPQTIYTLPPNPSSIPSDREGA